MFSGGHSSTTKEPSPILNANWHDRQWQVAFEMVPDARRKPDQVFFYAAISGIAARPGCELMHEGGMPRDGPENQKSDSQFNTAEDCIFNEP
jgi:hypothetical protein